MALSRDTFCSFCGTRYGESAGYPRPNRVLLFSIATPIAASTLPPFVPSSETSGRGLVFGPEGLEDVFAFPLHVDAARRYFSLRGITGPHAFAPR